MKKYKFKINAQTYEVEVSAFDGNNASVSVNGTSYNVELIGEEIKTKTPVLTRTPVVNKPGEGEIKKATGSSSVYKVESPLPGTIFKLKIAVGDTVKAGDVIMIMEAMKMENNIVTEKGGVIRSIKVKEGDAVLQSAILAEIDI